MKVVNLKVWIVIMIIVIAEGTEDVDTIEVLLEAMIAAVEVMIAVVEVMIVAVEVMIVAVEDMTVEAEDMTVEVEVMIVVVEDMIVVVEDMIAEEEVMTVEVEDTIVEVVALIVVEEVAVVASEAMIALIATPMIKTFVIVEEAHLNISIINRISIDPEVDRRSITTIAELISGSSNSLSESSKIEVIFACFTGQEDLSKK